MSNDVKKVKKYELAEKDYKQGLKYADIAKKYGVSLSTVKTWKRRYWSNETIGTKKLQKDKKLQPAKKSTLSMAEQVFCSHYVECWNGTQAALKSKLATTKKSAANKAYELLKRDDIKNEIKHLKNIIREGIKVDINDLLKYCLKIIYADIGDYAKWGQRDEIVVGNFGPIKIDGKVLTKPTNFLDLVNSSTIDTSVINEVKITKEGASIKLMDKKWAWEIVMKYFDLVPNVHQRKMDVQRMNIEKEKLAISKIKSIPPEPPTEPLVLEPYYGRPDDDEIEDD